MLYEYFLFFYIIIAVLFFILGTAKKYNYLFITCYFEDEKYSRKRHTPQTYRKWISTFFRNIKNNVIVYTNSVNFIKKFSPLRVIYCKNVESLPININKTELYKYQMKIETCNYERNWIAKMIWNSKLYFMNEITNLYYSSVYIWIDIGCMRDNQTYSNLPNSDLLSIISNNNEMSFFITRNKSFNPHIIKTFKCLYIIGTSFFGSKIAIQKYSSKFYKFLDYCLINKIYFGIDQNILDYVTFKYFKNSNIYPLYKSKCNEKSVFWNFLPFYSKYKCSLDIQPFKFKSYFNITPFKGVIKCDC